MKAARLYEYSKDFNESVRLVDVPDPEITGPFDVIVKIGGAGVCRTDIHIIQAVWRENLGDPKLPYTIGHENAGWVEAVGAAVTGLKKGDPVICHPFITCGLCYPCRTGYDMACEDGKFPGLDGTDGGYAEYLKTSVRSVIKLAPGTDPVPLAPFADAGITAYHAVIKALPYIHPGTTVVVVGIGGLGHFGVQLLKVMSPATVIALDTSRERLEFAERLGADKVALAGDDGGVAEILKLTGGKGADVILDFVAETGTPAFALQYMRQARGGTYITVGYGGDIRPSTLDLISKEFNIIGSIVGSYAELTELMELNHQGRVHISATTFPMSEYARALTELDKGHVLGRGVLVPDF
jgi:D-arabinose 1-dehydrogenase-like Zn-dependent alcohol dehydrogenase